MKSLSLTKNDVLEIIKTKRDALFVIAQIEQMLTQSFNTAKSPENLLEEHFSYDRKTKILNMLSHYTIDIKNPVDVEAFFIVLKQAMQDMPIVGIVTAIPPKQELVNILSSWFIVSVKKSVLLDITVNESLIGGAIIMYNGIHHDYSLKKQLHEKYKKGELKIVIANS